MFGNRILIPIRFIRTSAYRCKEVDLLTEAYLKQIRDLAAKQKASGPDFWESSAEFKKTLQDQLNRLATKYQLPNADAVTKLDLNFEKPKLESSVAALSEGKPAEALLEDLNMTKKKYDEEQAEERRKVKEMTAKLGQQEEFMPFPMPLKEEAKKFA
uniref:ATP synthase-coupling factor 6, mitochondrial n=1 Tax=Meloidogyne incognita TaxID=6306 RepID=A0A914LN69_MELIC